MLILIVLPVPLTRLLPLFTTHMEPETTYTPRATSRWFMVTLPTRDVLRSSVVNTKWNFLCLDLNFGVYYKSFSTGIRDPYTDHPSLSRPSVTTFPSLTLRLPSSRESSSHTSHSRDSQLSTTPRGGWRPRPSPPPRELLSSLFGTGTSGSPRVTVPSVPDPIFFCPRTHRVRCPRPHCSGPYRGPNPYSSRNPWDTFV